MNRRLAGRLVIYALFAFAVLILSGPFEHNAIIQNPANAGDFIAHLAGARLLIDRPSSLYDPGAQFAAEQTLVSHCCPGYEEYFLSPPFVALIYAPFLGIGLPASQALWFFLSVGLLIVSLVLLGPLLPKSGGPGRFDVAVAFFAAWPTVEMLLIRQDSAIALLLLVVGLRLLSARHDAWGGAVLALGLYKPQLFLYVPVLLLLQRRRAALGGWLTAAAALVALSIALVGIDRMRDLIALLESPETAHLMLGRSWQMISMAALARGILGDRLPMAVTAVTFGLPIGLLGWLVAVARQPARTQRQFARLFSLALVAGLLATPYAYEYDAIVLVLPLALFIQDRAIVRVLIIGYTLAGASLVRDLVHGNEAFPIPLLPLAILALLIALACQCSDREGHRSLPDDSSVPPVDVPARNLAIHGALAGADLPPS